jgi:hypothetical protein
MMVVAGLCINEKSSSEWSVVAEAKETIPMLEISRKDTST